MLHVILVVVTLSVVAVRGQGMTAQSQEGYEGVGVVLTQVVERYLATCHLTLVNAAPSDQVVSIFNRYPAGLYMGVLIMDTHALFSPIRPDSASQLQMLYNLWESDATRFACRAIILDLTAANTTEPAAKVLQATQVEWWPEVVVIAVGEAALARPFLKNPVLRNTVHTLYIAPHNRDDPGSSDDLEVLLYSRCHFCHEGGSKVLMRERWNPHRGFQCGARLFPKCNNEPRHALLSTPCFTDQFRDCGGHKFRVVSMDWFPFLQFTRDSSAPGTTVTPRDSLDIRMLNAIARVLNFTYEMRVPWDDQWGMHGTDGNWTGTVGILQHRKADFSMLLNWSHERKGVIDFSRTYAAEPLVIVTSKPRPLPHYLAIVSPFTGEVWLAVLVMCVFGSGVYWALQKLAVVTTKAAHHRCHHHHHLQDTIDTHIMNYGTALFSAIGILFLQPIKLPTSITGQVFVGWWCIYGILVTTMYRSSLVAHLSVPGKGAPINTFQHLLARDGWSWGLEPTYGTEWEWFKTSTNPTINTIFKGIQVLDTEEHLARVLGGRHALLTWKYHIQNIITSHYTDTRGYTPFHTSHGEYYVSTGYGWGFRRGAPFLRQMDSVKQRLLETGLVNYWLTDLIHSSARRVKKTRLSDEALKTRGPQERGKEAGESQMVLSVQHLQGSFYCLLIGYGIALLTFLVEVIVKPLSAPQSRKC